ncbi:MAG: 2OG-Fe(II) oxygenase [Xanthomonadales bacterium]|nr:2OG-Fe(II) oxygenase [Xanthomonadales bacterium]
MDPLLTAPRPEALLGSALLERIAEELTTHGFSIQADALPHALGQELLADLHQLQPGELRAAGIGRGHQHLLDQRIRGDQIHWIGPERAAGRRWLTWVEALRLAINRRLLLGIESFQSHYSHYPVGQFYSRHLDAFVGKSNRILSLVTYLNPNWQADHGGELVIFRGADDDQGIVVEPRMGTTVLFLSEEFPHEVRITHRDRYAIAGWFDRRGRGPLD